MGWIFWAPAFLILIVAAFWDLIISFRIVAEHFGTVAAAASLFVFPFLVTIAPWYEGFWHGDWSPLGLTYGGGLAIFLLYWAGSVIHGRLKRPTHTQPVGSRRTGLAIIAAIVLAFAFYPLYYLLFQYTVSRYAAYDRSFGEGIGAIVLLLFGTNVLSFVSGTVVSRRIFPQSSSRTLFYGLAVFVLVASVAGLGVLTSAVEQGSIAVVIGLQIAICATTLWVLHLLLPKESEQPERRMEGAV